MVVRYKTLFAFLENHCLLVSFKGLIERRPSLMTMLKDLLIEVEDYESVQTLQERTVLYDEKYVFFICHKDQGDFIQILKNEDLPLEVCNELCERFSLDFAALKEMAQVTSKY